ncbi:MAG: HIT domain-containing protein [Candidatus Zixiibacteriota bacterium]
MKCVFCDIVAGIEEADIFHEDDDVIVFRDHFPRAPTHLLICPKKHYTDLMDAPPEIMPKMHEAVQLVARKLGADTGGFRLIVNNGSTAGQIVFHLHYHFLTHCEIK